MTEERYASGARFAYVGGTNAPPLYGESEEARAGKTPRGIGVFRIGEDGAFEPIQEVPSLRPLWVALDPSERFLYATNTIREYEGRPVAAVEAWAVDHETGRLTFLNREATSGAISAHLSVLPSGAHLVVANYGGAGVDLFRLRADGGIGELVDTHRREGKGPHQRQDVPRPHMAAVDPSGWFVVTADLGIDRVHVFRVADDRLVEVQAFAGPSGMGTRHVAFHPNGRFVYVNGELAAKILVCPFDTGSGRIGEPIQTVPSAGEGFDGETGAGAIVVHPSGNFLYVSNRVVNSIVVFSIDPATGGLALIGQVTEGIDTPREFRLDPAGNRLYVLNQGGDDILHFDIDWATGELADTSIRTRTLAPATIAFKR
jgi:6-phosphogluconolactonase (cycloisomerase 2 family)